MEAAASVAVVSTSAVRGGEEVSDVTLAGGGGGGIAEQNLIVPQQLAPVETKFSNEAQPSFITPDPNQLNSKFSPGSFHK